VAASRLTAAGRPVSRRALRSEGIRGSNQALNALARTINAELAGTYTGLGVNNGTRTGDTGVGQISGFVVSGT
jgi:hypothetical protein